jgi:hypothetical protein
MEQYPMAHKIDTRKKYVPAAATNVAETIRREIERLEAAKKPATVRQLRSK